MYKLNENFLSYDGFDLDNPKLFLFNVVTHVTYVLEGDAMQDFFEVIRNGKRGKKLYAQFREYGFFEEL